MSAALKELEDIVKKGLVSDIFKMERAYALLSAIGSNADWANTPGNGNFGELFGVFQTALQTEAVLSVARIYDRSSSRYPTRCIRRALKILEEHASELPDISESYNTKLSLRFLGENSASMKAVDEGKESFLKIFVPEFLAVLDSEDVTKAIESLKQLRDKDIAHNENAQVSGPTWEMLQILVSHAQNFVGVVGWAFFNTLYVSDEKYFLSFDAERPSLAFNRLIRRLEDDV